MNETEPFFGNKDLSMLLNRVGRAVCAVALRDPAYAIVGSGFLIAKDLVITNYHVLQTVLKLDENTKVITANGSGSELLFFFDYMGPPPPNVYERGKGHTSLCVTAADKWLEFSRPLLPLDGTLNAPGQVTDEFDYAVVKLRRPVGNLPVSRSGGAIRGWLELASQIEFLKDRRIIVFQHPGQSHQLVDIGEFVQLDPTSTRVWYTVSTAKGSSGGAAVDTEGRLFALHNAEVDKEVTVLAANGRRVNQGVRIDRIANDLGNLVPRDPVPQNSAQFWSLNDDLDNPSPIIGRAAFQEMVAQMGEPQGERVLVVTGPPLSGLHYSIKLLRRPWAGTCRSSSSSRRMQEQPEEQLSKMTSKLFLEALVNNLGVIWPDGKPPIPEQPATENVPKWLNDDLPKWLLKALSGDERLNRTKYPAWVVINTVVGPNASFLWANHLNELIASLLGANEKDSQRIDLPQLRWLFLAKDPEMDFEPRRPAGGRGQAAHGRAATPDPVQVGLRRLPCDGPELERRRTRSGRRGHG